MPPGEGEGEGRGARPVFLDRAAYRRRRLADAARALPVAGAFLALLPALWGAAGGEVRTAAALMWVFGTWAGVVILAAVLARRLGAGAAGEDAGGPGEGAGRPEP